MSENWQSKKIKSAKVHQDLVTSMGVNNLNLIERSGRDILLDDGRKLVEFVSCSYLGLENNSEIADAAIQAIKQYGVQFAAARTRIKPKFYDELDEKLSEIFSGAYITTFNAVAPCHSAVFPLLGSGELPGFPIEGKPFFIMDKTSHASIQLNRGLLSQFGELVRIDFNDNKLLADYCEKAYQEGKTPIMISDSVGSMGGVLPVNLILELAEKYKGYAYLDDAHGTSVFGDKGEGYVLDQTEGQFSDRLILVGSLSKAFGAHGGFVATKCKEANDFIKKFGSTYVFGGPPSLPGLAACLASAELHLKGEVKNRQNKLRANLEHFDGLFGETLNSKTDMPIRGVRVGDEQKAINICSGLQSAGYSTTVAMYPTVPKGEAIIRCALSSDHSFDDISGLWKSYVDLVE